MESVYLYSIQYETCKVREHLKKIGDNSEQTRNLQGS